MKPYQHHDPILDKGKAVPKPKRPTTRRSLPAGVSVLGNNPDYRFGAHIGGIVKLGYGF